MRLEIKIDTKEKTNVSSSYHVLGIWNSLSILQNAVYLLHMYVSV